MLQFNNSHIRTYNVKQKNIRTIAKEEVRKREIKPKLKTILILFCIKIYIYSFISLDMKILIK